MICTYATLNERDGGQYSLGESTQFGAEHGEEPGLFETAEEAISDLTGYFMESNPFCSVADVTETEGFQGWGTVLRVSVEGDMSDTLYSVVVE